MYFGNGDNAFSIPCRRVYVPNDKAPCVQIGESGHRCLVRNRFKVRDADRWPVWGKVCDDLQEPGCKRFDFSLWCGHLCTKCLSV